MSTTKALRRNNVLVVICIIVGTLGEGTMLETCRGDIRNVKKGRKLDAEKIRTLSTIGRLQCGKECVAITSCVSVNYNQREATCELNSNNDVNGLRNITDWEYILKLDFMEVFEDRCSNECPQDSKCVQLKSAITKCIRYVKTVTCPDPPYKAYTSVIGSGTTGGSTRKYQCDAGAILVSGTDPFTITCESTGTWQTPNIECTKCASYSNTYTQRTDWFFDPPVLFTPSISSSTGVSPSHCANACNTRQDFFCVAFYYEKSAGEYCVLRPMRVHDNTTYIQFDHYNTDYDEYIRNCD